MLIKRHYTADSLNEVVNHPDIFKWVKGGFKGSKLDLTPVVENEDNVLLMGQWGGVLFVQKQLSLFEAHVSVLPEGRGKWALDMVNEALKWMFTKTNAVEITTRVPKGNLGALALVRAIHGVLQFTLPKGWVFDNKFVPAGVYSLTVQDWQRTAPGLVERGQWFHHRLESEQKQLGNFKPSHEDDPIHDRYVGAAVETILGGQVHKGVIYYGRWSTMAGYVPIHIVTETPLVLDIGTALISVRNNNFWVLGCRLAQH
jgi:hypothetical protein